MQFRLEDAKILTFDEFSDIIQTEAHCKFEIDLDSLYYITHKAKNAFLIYIDFNLFLFIKDYAGEHFHCLFTINCIGDIVTCINQIISNYFQLKLNFVIDKVVIRGLKKEQYNNLLMNSTFQHLNICTLSSAYLKFTDIYPFDSNYPQIVFNLPSDKSIKLYTVFDSNKYGLNNFGDSKYSRFRYEVSRINKRFNWNIREGITDNDLRIVINEWLDSICENNDTDNKINIAGVFYRLENINSFWLSPLLNYSLFLNKNLLNRNYVNRYIYTRDGLHKGLWIGRQNEDCLMVYMFLTNRKRPLFADLLLFDIISYCFNKKIKYINLGGAEEQSLYNFKNKYIKYFDHSYNHISYDLMIYRDDLIIK